MRELVARGSTRLRLTRLPYPAAATTPKPRSCTPAVTHAASTGDRICTGSHALFSGPGSGRRLGGPVVAADRRRDARAAPLSAADARQRPWTAWAGRAGGALPAPLSRPRVAAG